MTELFDDNQRDLERAVENLGYLLEQNPEPDSISKLRADITNQSVSDTILGHRHLWTSVVASCGAVAEGRQAYVQKRHDILMDDTLKGYLEVSV